MGYTAHTYTPSAIPLPPPLLHLSRLPPGSETYDGEDDELSESLRVGGGNGGSSASANAGAGAAPHGSEGASVLDNAAINALAGIGDLSDIGGGRGGGAESSMGGLDLMGPLDIIDAAWGQFGFETTQ